MALTFPVIVLGTAAEAFAITLLFPQYLPHNPFVWTLIRAAAVNLILFFTYHVFVYPFFLSPLRHLPMPPGSTLLLGHGITMFETPRGVNFLRWATEVPNDGLIHYRGFLYKDGLLLTDPKALSEVLVQKPYDFEKPGKLRDFLRQVLGDGLIIVEGDEHRFQRKHIMPAFQFRHIKELYPMMWKKAVAMTQGVNTMVHENAEAGEDVKGVVEISHWSTQVTMDIIGVAGLGREFNALKNSDDELVQNYEELLEPTTEKMLYMVSQLHAPPALIQRLPWKVNERFRVTTGNLNRICNQLVRDKREAIKLRGDENVDILSLLIKSNNFSDQQLADQMLTFLAAGHETTSSAFTWVTYLLATHSEIQARLRDEIRNALPTNPGPDEDLAGILESLPLLNAVCNETLRLYPTVPITVRQACRPTEILGQYVPEGTFIILCPWAINRSPHLWGADANKFVPDRWINPNGKPNNNGGAPSNYALLTFLHGPRSCIGGNFAKAELRCLVAAFTAAFNIEYAHPGKDPIPAGVVTTKPRDGMDLRLTPLAAW